MAILSIMYDKTMRQHSPHCKPTGTTAEAK
jgi:hypothetical protein